MIIASNAIVRRSGHARSLATLWQDVKFAYAQRRAYARTVKALSELSDRELADLGITRGQITTTAREAIYHSHPAA